MADVLSRIVGAESGGDPFATNPRSSAGGRFQFIDSTWLDTLRKHRPDLMQGRTREQLLALKMSDPRLHEEMGNAFTMDNQAFLKSRGIEPNDANTYLAHFAGPAGAAAIHANPGATVEQLLGARAVAANPFLRGKTGADVIAWAGNKMTPSQQMARSLRQRYGSEGASPAPTAAAPAAPGSFDKLKAALAGKKYDADWLATSEQMMKQGQEIGANAKNPLGALGGTLISGIGGYMTGKETGKKKADEAALVQSLGGASVPAPVQALLASSNPEYRQAGIDAVLKLSTPKAAEWVPTADGSAVVNKATGEVRRTGVDRKGENQPDIVKRAIAAGLKPGSDEFNEYVKNGPEKQARQGNPVTNAAEIRKEYNNLSKDFSIQLAGADRVRVGAKTDSPQGDIALVYGFMKMLDPGSVVREGEFATAENTGGIPERVRITYNKALNGERLTPDMRTAFVSQADHQIAAARQRQDAINERYSGIAKRAELDPADIITTYAPSPGAQAGGLSAPPPVADPNKPKLVPTQQIDPATGQPAAAPAVPGAPPMATAEQAYDPATGAPMESGLPQASPQDAGGLKAMTDDEIRKELGL